MSRWCSQHKFIVVAVYMVIFMAAYLSLCLNGH